MPACKAHQVEMAFVKVAHGWDEGDGTFIGQSCT
jgi:hypothetical protein